MYDLSNFHTFEVIQKYIRMNMQIFVDKNISFHVACELPKIITKKLWKIFPAEPKFFKIFEIRVKKVIWPEKTHFIKRVYKLNIKKECETKKKHRLRLH